LERFEKRLVSSAHRSRMRMRRRAQRSTESGRTCCRRGLTQIRAIDAVARTVTVEAGVTLGRLLATLAGCGLTYVMFSRD
jgi:FAD/FMN-containing dehydrogenase